MKNTPVTAVVTLLCTLGLLLGAPLVAFGVGAFPVATGGTGQVTFTQGVLYSPGTTKAFQTTATTSASCSGSTSCTAFTVFGSSPITISSSGGTSFGQTWEINANGLLAPTTTKSIAVNGTATSTFAAGVEATAIGARVFYATSTATSTFAGGLNITGTDCYAVQSTCLQTFIQNATAYKSAANYATAVVLAGTPSYNNGTAGVGATLTEVGTGALVVDGQNPSVGQRVLIKNQADQTQNGIYVVTAAGSGIASYILTRSTDYNTANDIYAGTTVPILAGGNTNGDTQWTMSTTGTIVVGASNIVFIETSFGTGGTVTSVGTATGLQGGPITTSGTLSLLSYLSTSSAETSGRIPFWTTTGGTPASLSGGSSNFTFNNANSTLFAAYGTSTAFQATTFYVGTTPVISNGGGQWTFPASVSATFVGGSGASTNVAYWSGANTVTNSSAFTYTSAASLLTVPNASTTSLTVSQGALFATNYATSQSNVGIATTSPWGLLSINAAGLPGPAFLIGSTTKTYFQVTQGGQVGLSELKPAGTSTSMVFDWVLSPTLITLNMGTSNYTITFINATSSNMAGSRKMIQTCNPASGSGGTPTFTNVEYAGGALPTFTTTANQCDLTSIYVGSGTSTPAAPSYKLFGASSLGFQ